MDNPSFRTRRQAGSRPTLLAGISLGIVLAAVTAICTAPAALAQQPAPQAGRGPAEHERVTRLQDSLDAGEDWDIGVPLVPVPSSGDESLAELIRGGRALDSEAYLALNSEFRRVRQLLQVRPNDEQVQQQLEKLQDDLARRIEINLEFDYLYAAAVYLELFRQADGPPGTLRRFSRRLSERRSARLD